MNKIILLRGLPGCGKSTWARNYLKTHPNTVRLSRDDMRESLFHGAEGVATPEIESLITEMTERMTKAALDAGNDVLIDATNLNKNFYRNWTKIGPVVVQDFPVDVEECIRRNAARAAAGGRDVPEWAIRKMAKNFIRNGAFPKPPKSKDWTPVEKVEQDDTLPPAIIVDVDGTIARMTGRNPYDHTRVLEDEPVEAVMSVTQAFAKSREAKVIILSGRIDACLDDTKTWLDQHGFEYDEIFMRKTGDSREDFRVKHEILRDQIVTRYHVLAAFDDRLQVCKMWHEQGITLFRVGDPEAVF